LQKGTAEEHNYSARIHKLLSNSIYNYTHTQIFFLDAGFSVGVTFQTLVQ